MNFFFLIVSVELLANQSFILLDWKKNLILVSVLNWQALLRPKFQMSTERDIILMKCEPNIHVVVID